MNKFTLLLTTLLLSMLLLGSAQAAIPTEASDAITALVTDATSFIGSLWAVVVAVTMGFLYIKLFKKGANKAT